MKLKLPDKIRKRLFLEQNLQKMPNQRWLLVQSPQPTNNPKQALNQKQLLQQLIQEDEVVGRHSLLLLIKK